jgi:hypothetical protein
MVKQEVVTVTGAEETAAFLRNAGLALTEAISEGLSEAGNEMHNKSQGLAAVDTGFMKSQINVTHQATSLLAVAGADYSSYVDEGTSRMRAQPFFTEPIKEIAGQIGTIVNDLITKKIGSNR